MLEFIASAWDEYEEQARDLRQDRYDMNLSKDDVANLKNADVSIFKTRFGE